MQGFRWTTAVTVALVSIGALAAPADASPAPTPTPAASARAGSGSGNSDVPRSFGPAATSPTPATSTTSGKSAKSSASTKSTDAAGADERTPLTPEQVRAQVAEASRLQAQLAESDAELAAASKKLAALAAASNSRMSAVTQAREAEKAAKKAEAAEITRLQSLTAQVAAARADVDGMAFDAYVNGPGMLGQMAALVDLVGSGGLKADAAVKARYVAGARAADEKQFAALAQQQRQAAAKAASLRAQREAATAKAEQAQKDASAAVAEQQSAVIALQKVAADRRARLDRLGVTGGVVAGVDVSALQQVSTTPLCTEEKTNYPNGQWPGSALCALRTAPGHMLRPSAARAYDAMSQAYQKSTGQPLCVTDSYRSLAAQIDVKRRKPTLAATPGTSNHGLGLAVDLCGGIESFGTPQHLWMQQHAPLFGFYHPAWAEPNGSKPEPWHWEYNG